MLCAVLQPTLAVRREISTSSSKVGNELSNVCCWSVRHFSSFLCSSRDSCADLMLDSIFSNSFESSSFCWAYGSALQRPFESTWLYTKMVCFPYVFTVRRPLSASSITLRRPYEVELLTSKRCQGPLSLWLGYFPFQVGRDVGCVSAQGRSLSSAPTAGVWPVDLVSAEAKR